MKHSYDDGLTTPHAYAYARIDTSILPHWLRRYVDSGVAFIRSMFR